MRKIITVLMAVLLVISVFSGCSDENTNHKNENEKINSEIEINLDNVSVDVPTFTNKDGDIQVKRLIFTQNDEIDFLNAGYANVKGYYLSGKYLNGSYDQEDGTYNYPKTPNFRKDAEGIIIYRNISYALINKDEGYYLVRICRNTVPGEYEFNDFMKRASKFHLTVEGTVSGGYGLGE